MGKEQKRETWESLKEDGNKLFAHRKYEQGDFWLFWLKYVKNTSRETLLKSATKSAKQWRVIYESGIVQNENEKVWRCGDWCEGGDFPTTDVG